MVSCDQADGYEALGGDCDDVEADIHPDADETCNGMDDDCDEDENDEDAIDCIDFYMDADRDEWGEADDSVCVCEAIDGTYDVTVSQATDCDDGDEDINPAETEICDDDDTVGGGGATCKTRRNTTVGQAGCTVETVESVEKVETGALGRTIG